MGDEERAESAPEEPVTPETVVSLIKTAQTGDFESYSEQREAVMKLWQITIEENEELQELAIRGLSELAWNHPHQGVASIAQDRLDRILKDGLSEQARELANQAIRHEPD